MEGRACDGPWSHLRANERSVESESRDDQHQASPWKT